jgi:hypothetical protein
VVERVTYTIAEVAAATGLSESGVRKAMRQGDIPTATKVLTCQLVPASWVRALDPIPAANVVPTQTSAPVDTTDVGEVA